MQCTYHVIDDALRIRLGANYLGAPLHELEEKDIPKYPDREGWGSRSCVFQKTDGRIRTEAGVSSCSLSS